MAACLGGEGEVRGKRRTTLLQSDWRHDGSRERVIAVRIEAACVRGGA